MACTSCGIPPGMEGFTDGKELKKQAQNGQCLYTTQGTFVCSANTEYDKWMSVHNGNTKGKVETRPFQATLPKY